MARMVCHRGTSFPSWLATAGPSRFIDGSHVPIIRGAVVMLPDGGGGGGGGGICRLGGRCWEIGLTNPMGDAASQCVLNSSACR